MEQWKSDDDLLAICNKIGESPVEMESVRTPARKPVVESTDIFAGLGVDLRDFDVGDPMLEGSAKPVTLNDNVKSRKDGKLVVELSDKTKTVVKDGPEAKSGTFSEKATKAASSMKSKANSEKHFADCCKDQNRCKVFKNFIKSLAVDNKSSQSCTKILEKFDQMFK